MQTKTIRIGPVAIPTTAGNLANPPTTTGGVGVTTSALYLLIKSMTIVNTTNAAITFSLYVGATGGSASNTQVMGAGTSVPANSALNPWYPAGQGLRLDAADFLTGIASATGLVLTIVAEAAVSG